MMATELKPGVEGQAIIGKEESAGLADNINIGVREAKTEELGCLKLLARQLDVSNGDE